MDGGLSRSCKACNAGPCPGKVQHPCCLQHCSTSIYGRQIIAFLLFFCCLSREEKLAGGCGNEGMGGEGDNREGESAREGSLHLVRLEEDHGLLLQPSLALCRWRTERWLWPRQSLLCPNCRLVYIKKEIESRHVNEQNKEEFHLKLRRWGCS